MNKISISQIDTLFVNGNYPNEFLFYFDNRINSEIIKKSLKKLSTYFWALLGKYENGQIHSIPYNEDLFLSEKTINEGFDPKENEIEIWRKYHQINPKKMETLFFISILQFNNGTVLIPKMNHLVGDGYSYFYFLSILSRISKESVIPTNKEMVGSLTNINNNRTILKEFVFESIYQKDPSKFTDPTFRIERIQKVKIAQTIEDVKRKYNESVSVNDILSAMVYKRILNNQNKMSADDFTLSIPIDVRRNVKELGVHFFGNGIMIHQVTKNSKELEKLGVGELALEIRKSMPLLNTQTYQAYLTKLETSIENQPLHSLQPYNPGNGCLTTNLTKMPIHRINFGQGIPSFVFTLTIGKNSAVILKDEENYILRFVY
jgi:hypothetical protein